MGWLGRLVEDWVRAVRWLAVLAFWKLLFLRFGGGGLVYGLILDLYFQHVFGIPSEGASRQPSDKLTVPA